MLQRVMTAVLAGSLILVVQPLIAQNDRGTITGTVTDQTGSVIPNAKIDIKNTATGALYTSLSTATGNYTVPSLPVGHYDLNVVAPGFSQFLQAGIDITVSQTARIDVVLKIGAATDTVAVNANATLLRTEDAEQSQTVNGDDINRLPLTFGSTSLYGARNPLASLTFAPGVFQVVGTNFEFRVNGSTDTARWLLDGQDITTAGMTSQHLSESHPSVEAVQEVTIESSNFAAEYGQVQGGLVNFTTRSGTNSLHGNVYDYLQNTALDAGRPYTCCQNSNGAGLLNPVVKNNDYGFNAGGPVYLPKIYNGKNRTFFFFNFDQFRNKQGVSGAATTVPTVAMRQGDFSGVTTGRTLGTDTMGRPILENTIYDPQSDFVFNGNTLRNVFPGNIIPANRFDPVALKVQSLIPMPTSPGNVNNLAVIDQVSSITTIPSVKADEVISDKSKVSFYWSEWRNDVPKSTGDGLPPLISPQREFVTRTNTVRLTADQTVTPTLLVHLGLGEIRYNHLDSDPPISQNYDAVGKLGLVGGVPNAQGVTGFPGFTGLSANTGGMASNMGWLNGVKDYDDKPTAVLSATLVKGNHTYKAGVEWHRDIWTFDNFQDAGSYAFSSSQTALPYLASSSLGGGSIGFPYASFLLGAVNSASVHPTSDPQVRKSGWGVYLQDTWKITHKLTLNYGLRWDWQDQWHEIDGRDSSFAPSIPNTAAGGLPGATAYEGYLPGHCQCSFTKTYPYSFGPRLAVAYQIDRKTVFRAGWGLVYGQTPPMNYAVYATIGVGFNTLTFSNPTFGEPAAQLQTGLQYPFQSLYAASLNPYLKPDPGTLNAPPTFLDPSGARPPRINQWNISLQREIFSNLLIEAAYVGNRSVWILGNNGESLNALSPQLLAARGLDVTNPATITLLSSTFASGKPQAAGFQLPYAGYPTGSTLAQSLRPYPQFSNVGNAWADIGDSWYDALQAKGTKRYSHGLQSTVSFTWQKELDRGITTPNNVYNKAVNRDISSLSQPFELSIGITYQTPKVRFNKWVSAIVRDWTYGATLRYSSGLPIQSPSGQNNLSTVLFQNTFMNRVPNQPLFLKDLNCHCIDPNKDFVLNPAAWVNPAAGTFGTAAAYYNDYRFQRHPTEQMGIGRIFRVREGITLELRAEFFNVFNRTQMADPSSGNALATQVRSGAGVPNSGFGYINSQSLGNFSTLNNNTGLGGNPRTGQLSARFRF